MSERPKGTLINPMARHLEAIGGPLRITHAEGVRLYDDTGRSWIDCETGSGVFSLGHRSCVFLDGDELDLGNHHLISKARSELAWYLVGELQSEILDAEAKRIIGRVCDLIRDELEDPLRAETHRRKYRESKRADRKEIDKETFRCVFNVSAGECIDAAIKLARGVTGKSTVLCADNAFHGCTGYALAASAPSFSATMPTRSPGFVHVPFGSADAIEQQLNKESSIAAVLLEPLAIEDGCKTWPTGYLQSIRKMCSERNVLLIVDESVTGLGRCGSTLACTQHDVIPDILTVGHALGGGVYPMYATCHRKSLDVFYQRNPFVHISTFGGGEVGCMTAIAAITKLSQLQENVYSLGEGFRQTVAEIAVGANPPVRSVRGVGLANAIQFCDVDAAAAMQQMLFDHDVFCRAALLSPDTLLFMPPLNITVDELHEVITAIESSLMILRERY